MTNGSSKEIATQVADHFGLIMAEAANGHSFSLLLTGEKANEAIFKEVLGALLIDYGVVHQFSQESDIPGIYARGLTPQGALKPIYLVVVGDPDAAQYALVPATMR